ncbi:DUF4307 domain-containing protein [Streptantibioticus ferralitis]|uniref:DUF4307 domain-containing protein n=1 Tax=Streptantibioticus ferralitis TaxID=236510 RepID=A0ABT5Z2J2_9ACTN|nr:DUF4307 domain-containing protein [Streptantibioticus ferralitis]MDF2257791.1 DUF4307 domain-containing protein [Streptantibioticus ferralitis]
MSAVRDRLPEGRYGRTDSATTDRRLKLLGTVLGGALVLGLGIGGWWYLSTNTVSGQVVTFDVLSDTEVRAHLEVHKDSGQTAVCTLRSQAADQSEVGRKDVTVGGSASTVDTTVTIRTTGRGSTAELLRCKAADQH